MEREAEFLSPMLSTCLIYSPAGKSEQLAGSCIHSWGNPTERSALLCCCPLWSGWGAEDRQVRVPVSSSPFLLPCHPSFPVPASAQTPVVQASCPGRELSGTVDMQTPAETQLVLAAAPASSIPPAPRAACRERTEAVLFYMFNFYPHCFLMFSFTF